MGLELVLGLGVGVKLGLGLGVQVGIGLGLGLGLAARRDLAPQLHLVLEIAALLTTYSLLLTTYLAPQLHLVLEIARVGGVLGGLGLLLEHDDLRSKEYSWMKS